jgi:hypothetical protein
VFSSHTSGQSPKLTWERPRVEARQHNLPVYGRPHDVSDAVYSFMVRSGLVSVRVHRVAAPPLIFIFQTSSSSAESVVYRHVSLTDINGPRVLAVLAIPAIAAIVAVLPWPASARQPTRIVSAVVATLFALLSAMTVGSFFLPTGIALIIAAWAGRTDRPPATGTRKS